MANLVPFFSALLLIKALWILGMDDLIVDMKSDNVTVDLNYDNPFVDVKLEIFKPTINSLDFTTNFNTFKKFKYRYDLLKWVWEEVIKLGFVIVINKSYN